MCIIFEKGIKPIKARKYYYFKYDTLRLVNRFACSHNDIDPIDRGVWRKYNPYNPYVESSEQEKANDTKIESLDDLFEDVNDAPVLPQDNEEPEDKQKQESSDELSYDVQKELEAKFDELFGALEDDDN